MECGVQWNGPLGCVRFFVISVIDTVLGHKTASETFKETQVHYFSYCKQTSMNCLFIDFSVKLTVTNWQDCLTHFLLLEERMWQASLYFTFPVVIGSESVQRNSTVVWKVKERAGRSVTQSKWLRLARGLKS